MEVSTKGNTDMHITKRFFIFTFFLLNLLVNPSIFANSQDYRYTKSVYMKHFSLTDGLSQNTASDMIQDSEGYIWIATDGGLNRFDSYEFEIFRNNHKDSNSLHENGIVSLMEELDKGIWIGTIAGPSFYDFSTKKFINYTKSSVALKTNVLGFSYSSNNMIWLGSENGLFYLDRKIGSNFLPFKSLDGIQISGKVMSLIESGDYLFVSADKCIYRINVNDFSLINLCNDNLVSELEYRRIITMAMDGDSLWIGTNDGLLEYNLVDGSVVSYMNDVKDSNSISNNFIMDLVLDENNLLWIATSFGLNKYDKEKNIFVRYEKKAYPDGGLVSNDILSVLVDKQGLIWIGTYGAGINLFDPKQKKFERLFTKSDAILVGNNNLVHGIEKDHFETLWLAVTSTGLISYDLMTGELKRPLSGLTKKEDPNIYSLFIDSNNRLWAGGFSELALIDVETKSKFDTVLYLNGVRIQTLAGIYQVYEDSSNDIWLVGMMGIYKVNKIIQENKTLFIKLDNLTRELPKSYTDRISTITKILNDQYGNIWAGGESGLLYFSITNKKWHHFTHEHNNQYSLSHDSVQEIFEDSNNFIWIGTGNGLNRVVRNDSDIDDFYFERVTTLDGLPNNDIYEILEDKQQQLWISTNLGLVRYLGKDSPIRSYRQTDGLSSDEFNMGSAFADSEERLYFGSVNGITVVHPVKSNLDVDASDIKFAHIQVGSREINIYLLTQSPNPKIIQQEGESIVKILVTNTDFRKPKNQIYRYRLLGLDTNWYYLEKSREISFAGLQEGDYMLEIQVQLPNKKWSERTRRLSITVKTNFWEASKGRNLILFLIGLFFLTTMLIIILYYRKKLKVIINKKELETLRRKEMAMNNNSLSSQLDQTEKQVVSLTDSVTRLKEKLGYKRYWDVITGFYKINYLNHIDEKKFSEEIFASSSKSKNYKSLCVLELNNITDIYNEFGTLALERFTGEVSKTIKTVCDSSFQIFKIESDKFLILSNHIDYKEFEKILVRVKDTIIRTEYELANGITRTTNVSLTLFDASLVNIVEKNGFMNLINFIIQFSNELTTRENPNDRRIIAKPLLSEYLSKLSNYQLNEMLQFKLIDLELI